MNFLFELFVGLRYLRVSKAAKSSGRNSFVSFISLISILGILLGVAALIVVLSVMNGFQKDVRNRMLSVVAHIEVYGKNIEKHDWQQVQQIARSEKGVIATAPFVKSEAVLLYGSEMKGGMIRGIAPSQEGAISALPLRFNNKGFKNLRAKRFNIILGQDLARSLGVNVGDRVSIMVPQGTISPAGLIPRFKIFNVVDIFSSGHYEYDSSLAYTNIEDAKTLLRLKEAEGLRLRVDKIIDAPLIAYRIKSQLWNKPYAYQLWVQDWSQQNRNWFEAVQTEKRLMAIILTLIIAVAAFNLVSSLVMTVTEKRPDIAILRTLGASKGMIMRIFMVQGSLSGIIGTLSGVALGLLIALNIDVIVPAIEAFFGIQFLPKSIYLISSLPSHTEVSDVVKITIVSLLLSFLATLYPSYRAAKVEPAQALRSE